MPIYSYKCSCGKCFTQKRDFADFDKPSQCECGEFAGRDLNEDIPLLTKDNNSLTEKIKKNLETMKKELSSQKEELERKR